MPTGRGFTAGPEKKDSWFLLPPGPQTRFKHVNAPDSAFGHTRGTGVLLPLEHDSTRGQVMQIAGIDKGGIDTGTTSLPDAETFDERTGQWAKSPSLQVARGHHNTVLLPDGGMVTVGGGVGRTADEGLYAAGEEHKQIELRDPTTGQWRLGPPQAENRAYHSTAILLADGSVVSSGDEYHNGNDPDTYEIYRPSYFFNGPRPTITSAPSTTGYGVTSASAHPTRTSPARSSSRPAPPRTRST